MITGSHATARCAAAGQLPEDRRPRRRLYASMLEFLCPWLSDEYEL